MERVLLTAQNIQKGFSRNATMPHWSNSVGCVLSCCWFDSPSGHTPRLWVHPQLWYVQRAADWSFYFPLSMSLVEDWEKKKCYLPKRAHWDESQGKDSDHARDACDSKAACWSGGIDQGNISETDSPAWLPTSFLCGHPQTSSHYLTISLLLPSSLIHIHTVQWKHKNIFK